MIEVIKEDWVPDFCHKTAYSAGYDLYCGEDIILRPMERKLINTGIRVNMMKDPCSFAMVVPRSGLSSKTNLRICNSPGTIDQDYTGPIMVCMQNIHNIKDEKISKGDRIAQIIFCHHGNSSIDFVNRFSDTTDRGSGGFGSTGK